MRDIVMGERKHEPPSIDETSVRIHGTLAVVNIRIRGRENDELWRTAILVKEANLWRQAAEIATPITGAARSTPR